MIRLEAAEKGPANAQLMLESDPMYCYHVWSAII